MSATYPPGQPETGIDQSARAGISGNGAGETAYGEASDTAAASRSGSLRNELTTLKSELDTLMEHVATLSEAELRDAYSRIMERFSSVRYAAKGMAAQAGQQFNQRVDATTEYVKERPLKAVGIAVGAGLLLGMLLGRR